MVPQRSAVLVSEHKQGDVTVLKISKAAMLAAVLSLSAVPAVGLVAASAEETTTTTSTSGFTSSVSVPTIVAVDSSMDETALRQVLTGDFLNHVGELAALNATSITIPEISLDVTVTESGTTTTGKAIYKDIVLSNVKDGVAETVAIGSVQSINPDGTFTYGKLTQTGVSFPALFAFVGLIPGTGDTMVPSYTSFTAEGGTLVSKEISCTIGKWSGTSADVRPSKVMLTDVIAAFTEMGKHSANPPPAALGTIVTYVTGLLQSLQSQPMSLDGLECKGNAEGKPVAFSIGGMTLGGFEPGVYPSFGLKDLKIDAGDQGSVSLASAELKPTDLNAPITLIQSNVDNLSPAWFNANGRALIPAFGGFSLAGLAVDVPNPEMPGSRIQANIANFDLTLSDYLNGIPTRIATSASGVDIPLPQDSTDDQVKMLLALGITRVNLGYELTAAWDKTTNTINVDKVSVSGKDLGSFAVAAVIGNAAEQLFAVDPNVAQAASLGLTVKNLTFDVTDAGLGDILAPMMAAQQGVDPANYRTQMAGVMEGAALALLGSTDAARALGTAVGDFVSGKVKALTINVASKDPNGIAVPVLMQASEDPTVLASQVEITGSAK